MSILGCAASSAADGERKKFVKYAAEREDEPGAYEDILWALINSTEFVTRH